MFDLIAGRAKHLPSHPALPLVISTTLPAMVIGSVVAVPLLFLADRLPEVPTMLAFVAEVPAPPLPRRLPFRACTSRRLPHVQPLRVDSSRRSKRLNASSLGCQRREFRRRRGGRSRGWRSWWRGGGCRRGAARRSATAATRTGASCAGACRWADSNASAPAPSRAGLSTFRRQRASARRRHSRGTRGRGRQRR